MEFTPRAAELTTLLENRIINYYTDLKVDEIGRVVSVGDGIARVYGLNEIQAGEMVEFASGVKGIALNLVEVNFFLDYHILSVVAYLSMLGFLIQAVILITKMDKPHIPDLNLTIPGSSDPGNSGEDDREREKKIRRCRGLVKKWVGDYCRQVCLGRGVCSPKCISQMSTAEQDSLINHIWSGFRLDEERPSLRRIDYIWRKARDLAPSEVNNHPIMRAWKGQWDWDDF